MAFRYSNATQIKPRCSVVPLTRSLNSRAHARSRSLPLDCEGAFSVGTAATRRSHRAEPLRDLYSDHPSCHDTQWPTLSFQRSYFASRPNKASPERREGHREEGRAANQETNQFNLARGQLALECRKWDVLVSPTRPYNYRRCSATSAAKLIGAQKWRQRRRRLPHNEACSA